MGGEVKGAGGGRGKNNVKRKLNGGRENRRNLSAREAPATPREEEVDKGR